MDVSVGGKDVQEQLGVLSKRLDVVEQTVTAEQESSLSALEAIVRATQQRSATPFSASARPGSAVSLEGGWGG